VISGDVGKSYKVSVTGHNANGTTIALSPATAVATT
jgi:hypothetical protein